MDHARSDRRRQTAADLYWLEKVEASRPRGWLPLGLVGLLLAFASI